MNKQQTRKIMTGVLVALLLSGWLWPGVNAVQIVLLTSYTTVSERTRQIGIMKALGASRWFIALAFLKESLLISSGGIAGGLLLSWLSQFALKQWNGTHISFERDYIALAVMGGLLFNLLGALYPAWHAAGLDAVDALSYE